MDFFEQWFGISPDGGTGSLELLYLAVIVAIILIVVFTIIGVLAAIAEARKNLPHVAPANPAESLLMPGSQIGLERKVVIRVSSHQLIVDSELPITVAPGTSREDLQDQLAEALRMHFAGWEQPPSGFYWLPLVRFAVLPGGQQFAKRLTDLTNDWEIKSKVDFVLE